MLVIQRREGDVINLGPDITITVVRISNGDEYGKGMAVRIGIDAPKSVHISRPDAKSQEHKERR